jgi:hypothetical protein
MRWLGECDGRASGGRACGTLSKPHRNYLGLGQLVVGAMSPALTKGVCYRPAFCGLFLQEVLMDYAVVMQWLFGTEVFTNAINWPVNVDGLVAAKKAIDEVVGSKASAIAVVEAYKKFAGAIGPTAMNALLESDDAFPEVNHSGRPTPPANGKVVLYVDPAGKCVLATCTKEWGMTPVLSVQ